MIMVEIDRNAILVDPIKSRKDGKLMRTYSDNDSKTEKGGNNFQKAHIRQ